MVGPGLRSAALLPSSLVLLGGRSRGLSRGTTRVFLTPHRVVCRRHWHGMELCPALATPCWASWEGELDLLGLGLLIYEMAVVLPTSHCCRGAHCPLRWVLAGRQGQARPPALGFRAHCLAMSALLPLQPLDSGPWRAGTLRSCFLLQPRVCYRVSRCLLSAEMTSGRVDLPSKRYLSTCLTPNALGHSREVIDPDLRGVVASSPELEPSGQGMKQWQGPLMDSPPV